MSGQTLVLTIKVEDVTVKIGSKIIYQVALFSANKILLSYRIFVECCFLFHFFKFNFFPNLIFRQVTFRILLTFCLHLSTENWVGIFRVTRGSSLWLKNLAFSAILRLFLVSETLLFSLSFGIVFDSIRLLIRKMKLRILSE